MKRFLALLLVCLLLTGCAANSPAETPAETPTEEVTAEEKPAAEEESEVPAEEAAEEPLYLGTFSAQSLTGETVNESIFSEADLTVINLWATYCGPCKQEMPILGALDRELENVQILGIVTDVIDQQGEPDENQVALALEIMEACGCDYPSLILNQDLAYLGFASLQAVPATLFVDSEGYLAGLGFYGALDEDGWRQVIAERLEMVQQ